MHLYVKRAKAGDALLGTAGHPPPQGRRPHRPVGRSVGQTHPTCIGRGRRPNLTLMLGNAGTSAHWGFRMRLRVIARPPGPRGGRGRVRQLRLGRRPDDDNGRRGQRPTVDQPGVTDSEIKVSGIASRHQQPARQRLRRGLRRRRGLLRDDQLGGRHLRTRPEAGQQARRRARQREGRGRRASSPRTMLRRHPHRRAPLRGRRGARRRQDPHLRVERQRGVDRPRELLRAGGRPLLRLRRASGLPWLAKELGKKKVGAAGLQRPPVGRLRQGHRGVVREVPLGRDRVQHRARCRSASPTSAPTCRR